MRATRRHARASRLLAVAAIGASGLVAIAATPSTASPAQESPSVPRVRSAAPGGEIEIDVDVFKAADRDVVGALDDLHGNLKAELAGLDAARSELTAAQAARTAADDAVTATRQRIDELTAQSDDVVVDAFVNPSADTAIDVLTADSMADAAVKASIVGMQRDVDAAVLAQLRQANDELAALEVAQDDAARTAVARTDDATAALADLEAAQSQEAAFVVQVQSRLDQKLAEADALAQVDPLLAEQLRAQETAIAGRLEAIRAAVEYQRALEALHKQQAEAEAEARRQAEAAAAAPDALGPVTGRLSTVGCPGGGSITVDSSLAGNLGSLLQAAEQDGLSMCGGGFRDPAEQIALRRAHCGSSNYAIYQAPSSSCSPPTARPGTSNHERGVAIDFTCGGSTVGRGSACFRWLQGHAARYGLYNLPSEPWHWSVDGT